MFTMGINRARKEGWIFEQMGRHLCRGEGRVMGDKNGVLASIFYDNKMHSVITNAWKKQQQKGDDRYNRNNEETVISMEERESESGIDSESEGGQEYEEREDETDHPGAEWAISKIWQGRKNQEGFPTWSFGPLKKLGRTFLVLLMKQESLNPSCSLQKKLTGKRGSKVGQ